MNERNNSEELNNHSQKWEFCPRCGNKLPPVEGVQFCSVCKLNIGYIKKFGKLPPQSEETLTKKSKSKLTEDDIYKKEKKNIWSSISAISLPLLIFLGMNFLVVIIFIIFVFFLPNFGFLESLLNSPMFLIIFSLFELLFLIIPIIFVGKYLDKPTLKNRLRLLGLPIRKTSKLKILKEVFLGLGFAVLSVILVNLVSVILELLFSLIFDLEIIYNNQIPTNDVDLYISSANLIEIILFVLIMILVVGPSEEIAFRGYMQQGLVNNTGKTLGIVVTALIFTMIHLLALFLTEIISLIYFLISFLLLFFPYLLLSFLLGILFHWRNQNILAPIIMHGVYNSITVLIGYIFFNYSIRDALIFSGIVFFFMIISFIMYILLNKIEK